MSNKNESQLVKHDWSKFRETRNDRNVLMDKAAVLTPVIVQIAENTVIEIESLVEGRTELKIAGQDVRQFINVRKIDKKDRSNAIWEFLLFLLHMTDRITFEKLGDSKRETFMVVLWENVGQEMLRRTKQFVPPFMVGHPISETYKERQKHYSQYKKLVAEKGKPQKDTLLWEFGKILTGAMTNGKEDVGIIMTTMSLALRSIEVMNLSELLEETK